MKIAIAALVLGAVLSSPASSRAQDMPPEVRARGRRLQAEAMAHVEAERWALAAEAFRQTYELGREHNVAQAPIGLWNMALALMRIPGREAEALDAFRRFLDESTTLTDDAQVRDWRSTAVEHIAELEARIGSGSGAAPPTDAGDASPSEAAPAEPVEPRDVPSGGGISPVGPIVLGFGGVALAASAILGGVALAQDGELVSRCGGAACIDTPEHRGAYDDVRTLAAVTDVLLAVGVVTAITGAALSFTLTEGGSETTATASVRPGGAELAIGGSF